MNENLTGLIKIVGISLVLAVLWGLLASYIPDRFLSANNIENLMRRTALYGVLGIGVAFVIISSGIDLSIGSLVCLSACLLATFLRVDYVEVDSIAVWDVDATAKTIVVDEAASYQIGDSIWYDKDRRNRSLLEIVDITASKEWQQKRMLVVTGELKHDQKSADGQPVAHVTKAYPVRSVQNSGDNGVEQSDFQVADDFPSVRLRDKVKLVHPKQTNREADVAEQMSAGMLRLNGSLTSVDESFFAIPIRRTAMMSIPLAILSVLGISLFLGLLHGLLVTRMNLQPFVVTLCGLLIYRGLSRSLTNDQTVGFIEYRDTLGKIATGRWEIWPAADGAESFGVPYSFFIFVAFTVMAMVLLNLTVWGRHLFATGRNAEATRYSGINTNRVTMMTYVICSGLAGIGGMMFAIDSNSIAPSGFGNFFELYAIAAAVLGGCSLRGGEGSILGVVIGTALMQTLYSAIVLLKISEQLEFTIIGAVILGGAVVDELLHRFAARMKKRSG